LPVRRLHSLTQSRGGRRARNGNFLRCEGEMGAEPEADAHDGPAPQRGPAHQRTMLLAISDIRSLFWIDFELIS